MTRYHLPADLERQARVIKKQGGAVFLVIPEIVGEEAAKLCGNCNGVGHLGIQWLTGGPYEAARQCQNKADPEGSQNVPSRCTYYNGKYYHQKTRTSACPVCNGTGQPQRASTGPQELAF